MRALIGLLQQPVSLVQNYLGLSMKALTCSVPLRGNLKGLYQTTGI